MKLILISFLVGAVLFALFCVIDNHVDKGELIPTKNPYEKRLERKILTYIDEIKQLEKDYEDLVIHNGEIVVKLRREKSTLKFRLKRSIADCEKMNKILIADMNKLTLEYMAREKQMKKSHLEKMAAMYEIIKERNGSIVKLKNDKKRLNASLSDLKLKFDVTYGKLKREQRIWYACTFGPVINFTRGLNSRRTTTAGIGFSFGLNLRKLFMNFE